MIPLWRWILFLIVFVNHILLSIEEKNIKTESQYLEANDIFYQLKPYAELLKFTLAPTYGYFADTYESEVGLLLAYSMSTIVNLIICISTFVPAILFLTLLPDVFTHATLGTQIFLSKYEPLKQRTLFMSLFNLGGFCFAGRFLGNWISPWTIKNFGVFGTSLITLVPSFLNIGGAYYIYRTFNVRDKACLRRQSDASSHELLLYVFQKDAIMLFLVHWILHFPNFTFRTSLKDITLKAEYFSGKGYFIYSTVGLAAVPCFIKMAMTRIVFKHFSDLVQFQILLFSSTFLYLSLVFLKTLHSFVVSTILLVTVITWTNDLLTTSIVRSVVKSERGKLLGLFYSLQETYKFLTFELITVVIDVDDLSQIAYLGMLVHSLLFILVAMFISVEKL